MRPSLSFRCLSITTILANAAGAVNAQPRQLYVWPSSPLHGRAVLDASVGGGPAAAFTIIINPDRTLDGAGSNGWGQLGFVPEAYQFPCDETPSLCRLPRVGTPPHEYTPPFRKVSAGWDHVLGLSDDPHLANSRGLIAWGLNATYNHCDIPMWNASGQAQAPRNIAPTAKVAKISAGEYINVVLFDNGQVAAWGAYDWGVDPRGPAMPGNHGYNGFLPNPAWTFKDVVAGGHMVMALILEAPGSGLPQHPLTGRVGEGWIISWGTFDYGNDIARGPGFRGYVNGQPAVAPSPRNLGGPAALYTPPYDELFAGHQVAGAVIRYPTADQIAAGIRAGTVHLWGTDANSVITNHNTNITYEQMQAGYNQWIAGWAIDDWTGIPPGHVGPPVPVYEGRAWGYASGSLPPPSNFPPGPIAGHFKFLPGPNAHTQQAALCYSPNCDGSTGTPALTANDFQCFAMAFASAQSLPYDLQVISYANCDGSTGSPVLTANDFQCFGLAFARGLCP